MPLCTVCRRSKSWHDENETVHPFTTRDGQGGVLGETRTKAQDAPRASASSTPAVMRWPFDPVLRQALLDKGLLTVEDLERAENKIRTASMVMGGGSSGSTGPAPQ